jgi:hypothetical protein
VTVRVTISPDRHPHRHPIGPVFPDLVTMVTVVTVYSASLAGE